MIKNKNLNVIIEQAEQQLVSIQIIQKMKLIEGDIKMDRNHKSNLDWLIMFNGELNKRITRESMLGNKVQGFVDLRNEIGEWINIVEPLALNTK